MNISRGPVKTAIRVGIYGTEGVGKSTFASQFPGAVFIDTEGSTKHMNVARFDPPTELSDVTKQIDYVIQHPEGIGTLVIDTVDWLEKLIFNSVCADKGIKNIEDMGYGKGYVFAKQKAQQLLEQLDIVIARGVHVVLVCHSMIRKFELPDEMGSYDRYTLKMNEKNIAPLIKEWVDLLLFVNYKTDIITDSDGKTKKGKGGQKRVMYANHSACWDAKNRFGLPDEMPFDYGQIFHLFGEAPPVAEVHDVKTEPEKAASRPASGGMIEAHTVDKVPPAAVKKAKAKPVPMDRPDYMISDNPEKDKLLDKLWKLMAKDGIDDPTVIQAVVAEKDYYDLSTPIRDYDTDFIDGCLIGAWDTVRGLAWTKIKDAPF